MKSLEYSGVWWMPNDFTRQFAGKLTYDLWNGGLLHVVQVFDTPQEQRTYFPDEVQLLHGFIGENYRLTLIGCRYLSSSPVSEKAGGKTFSETKIGVDIIYKGFQFFNRIEELTFDRLHVRYSYLSEWLTETVPKETPDGSIVISNLSFEPIDVEVDGHNLSLEFEVSGYRAPDAVVVIQSPVPISLSAYLKLVRVYLPEFLTLATSQPNFPTHVESRAPDRIGELYFAVPEYSEKEEEYLISSEMLFVYEDVRENLQSYLSKWIGERTSFETVLDLYFKPYFGRAKEIETVFLFLAQALEAIHRKQNPKKMYATKQEHKDVTKNLLKCIPDDICVEYSKRLKEIIRLMGNELSLRIRILDLMESMCANDESNEIRDLISDVIGNDWNDYAAKVANTRNVLSHHFEPRGNLISDHQLPDYAWRTQMLIEKLLLLQIGFKPAKVRKLIRGDSLKFWYLRMTKPQE